MKNLILKQLQIQNFKGIKDLTVDFSDRTTISGANALGKTTIFDAYSWLLWDKDSKNKKDFNIKPFNEKGEVLHGIEPTIIGQFEYENKSFELKKVYKEIWTKKRGQTESTFTGNTTDYYFNEVPIQKGEYNKRIESIITEREFNLLSNPAYFSNTLDKKDRRDILLSLIKNISKGDVLKANSDIKELDLDNYTIEELKAKAKASNKKANEDLEHLPVRINELEKQKKDYDFIVIENDKDKFEKALQDIDSIISKNAGSADVVNDMYKQIQLKQAKMQEIKSETDRKNEEIYRATISKYNAKKDEFEQNRRELRNSLLSKQNKIDTLEDELKMLDRKIKGNEEELEMLRGLWVAKNDEIFNGDLKCPTCQKEFDEDKKEEILSNFNLEKSRRLTQIKEQADGVINLIEKQKQEYQKTKRELEQLTSTVAELEQAVTNYGEFTEILPEIGKEDYPAEYYQLQVSIDTLNSDIRNVTSNDNSKLLEQKKEIQNSLAECNRQLAFKQNNEELERTIQEYKAEEKQLAKIYEDNERIIFLCEEYTRIYTSLVQDEVNGLFTEVNFRLFKTLVNGGIEETCDVMVNGVPYVDVNNAGKINAGLDVINTLGKHFEKQVPIFVDNAESVNELLKVNSQIVELYVSKDKKIKIKGE